MGCSTRWRLFDEKRWCWWLGNDDDVADKWGSRQRGVALLQRWRQKVLRLETLPWQIARLKIGPPGAPLLVNNPFLGLFILLGPFFLGPWTIIIQMEGAGSSLRKTSILWQNITWGGHRVLFWYVSQIVPSHSPASFFSIVELMKLLLYPQCECPVDFGKTTLLLFAETGKALATFWTCIGDSFLRSHKKLTVKLLACVVFLSQKSPWCNQISPR